MTTVRGQGVRSLFCPNLTGGSVHGSLVGGGSRPCASIEATPGSVKPQADPFRRRLFLECGLARKGAGVAVQQRKESRVATSSRHQIGKHSVRGGGSRRRSGSMSVTLHSSSTTKNCDSAVLLPERSGTSLVLWRPSAPISNGMGGGRPRSENGRRLRARSATSCVSAKMAGASPRRSRLKVPLRPGRHRRSTRSRRASFNGPGNRMT